MQFEYYQTLAMRSSLEQEYTKGLLMAIEGIKDHSIKLKEIIEREDIYHEIPKEIFKKELGDVLWYMAYMLDKLNLDLNDVALHNLERLKTIYPACYSDVLDFSKISH